MPGKMNGLQPMPDFEIVTVVQKAGGCETAKRKDLPTGRLQNTSNPGCPTINGMPGIVIKVEPGSGDPSPVAIRQFRDIENVIEVPMRQDDSANRNPGPSSAGKGAVEASEATDEACIQQVEGASITKDVEAHPIVANL